jgi:hypothetical protein
VKKKRPRRGGRGLLALRVDYSERQLLLVLARMPMKVGTKMVEAKTVTMSARYIRVSPMARATGWTGIAALYYNGDF